jgi:hemoglobin
MIATRWPVLSVRLGLFLAATVAVAGTPSQLLSQEKPTISRKKLDEQIANSARTAINDGADIFNDPKTRSGAVYFFRGSITALRPLLKDRPDLRDKLDHDVKVSLAKETPIEQAYSLRESLINLIAGLERMERYVNKDPNAKTLWARLGGEEGVTQIVDYFIDEAVNDKAVNFSRNGKYPMTAEKVAELKKQFVALAAQITGGDYPERKVRLMAPTHRGMGITNEEFDAMVGLLRKTLYRFEVNKRDVETMLERVEGTRRDIVGPPSTQVAGGGPAGTDKPAGADKPAGTDKPAIPVVIPPEPDTLWKRLGGQKGVEKIVSEFIDSAIKDPSVKFERKGKLTDKEIEHIKEQFVILTSAFSEGPHEFKGKANLADMHKAMEIKDAEFTAFKKNVENALKNNKIAHADTERIMEILETIRERFVKEKP